MRLIDRGLQAILPEGDSAGTSLAWMAGAVAAAVGLVRLLMVWRGDGEPLVFQHQSSDFYPTLKPVSYDELAAMRNSPTYMQARRQTEEEYHDLLPEYDREKSFLYATVVGFNKMKSAEAYPGFTYFFRLTPSQIGDTIFEVVDGEAVDGKHPLRPGRGQPALSEALAHWQEYESQLRLSKHPVTGCTIRPRVEVVIPFEVEYFDYVPQVEDR